MNIFDKGAKIISQTCYLGYTYYEVSVPNFGTVYTVENRNEMFFTSLYAVKFYIRCLW